MSPEGTSPADVSFGALLRQHRRRRGASQEQLAEDARVSTRHLSFMETGKASPSRDMVMALSRALGLELRDRNALLGAAGFASIYRTSELSSLRLAPVRRAIDLIFQQQEPFSAMLLDHDWNILDMNDGARRLVGHFMATMPDDPRVVMNIVRATLHPQGLKPCIANWPELAAYMVERLRFECAHEGGDTIDGGGRRALLEEVLGYPDIAGLPPYGGDGPVVPVHLRRVHDDGRISEARLFTMVTSIGTPLDVTAQELAIESTFPADDASDAFIRALAAAEASP
jgi:transcriptional regulator with XRE-family HTH domain